MSRINVKLNDGTTSDAHVKANGEFDILCPCGTALPVMTSSFPVGFPMLCPCGRQYEWDNVEPGETPMEIRELGK